MGLWAGVMLGVSGLASQAMALPGLQTVKFRGMEYAVCVVDPACADLRLYLNDGQGQPLHDFTALDKYVRDQGDRLIFAANAGMFEPNFRPVGLLVQNGIETAPLNLREGTGNFYMKPNGIFLINARHRALVVEASLYPALLTPALWATQSGPLLAQRGDIHPDFVEDSKNLQVRSGVGVRKDGKIVFAISRGLVNFYSFATLFVERLRCRDALYLDGHISAFAVPGIPEKPGEHLFGPMLGLVEKAP